jgi:transposase
LKWSGNFGQHAKMYPPRTNGYENDDAMEFFRKIQSTVALEALGRDKTVQEIAAKRQLRPTQVGTWKRQAIEGMAGVFSDKTKKAENKEGEIKDLHAKIGQLAVENDFLSQELKR